MNPHETLHTPKEIFPWLDKYGVEFLNLIPHYEIEIDNLFKKHTKPKVRLIDDLLMAIDITQIQEGGFFVIIGRKK